MSIYNGFGLRKVQEQYNKLVARLILMLQSDVLELMSPHYKSRHIQHEFQLIQRKKLADYKEIFEKLEKFEQHKYLEPKFSHFCTPLKNLIAQRDLVKATKTQRKAKSQKKRNNLQRELNEFKQKDGDIDPPHFLSESSIKRFNETMAQFGKKFQQKIHRCNKIKIKNEPFSIFTIQEVSQNVSRKNSIKKNNKLMEIPADNLDCKFKQKKIRIYKNNKKYSFSECQNNTDEPYFPSYRKKASQNMNDQHCQQKNKLFDGLRNSKNCEDNQVQTNSEHENIHNLKFNLTMDNIFSSSQLQNAHKMKSFTVMQQKPAKKVQKSMYFVKMRYKKLTDRSDFQKLYTKKKN